MPLSLMIEYLSELPYYARINLLIITGSGFLCLFLWTAGLGVRYLRKPSLEALPPVPFFPYSTFPNRWEQLYLLLFIILYTVLSSLGLLLPGGDGEAAGKADWEGSFFLILLYLPFILRLAAMPPGGRGTVRQYIILPLCVIFLTYGVSLLMECFQLSQWLVDTTQSPETQDVIQTMQQSHDPWAIAALLFAALIVAPIGEECAFRGFLYTTLRRQCGPVIAALAGGLFFGAIHCSLPQLLPLTVFGIAQCWIYEKTRTLWVPIATHFLFNACSSFLVLTGILD